MELIILHFRDGSSSRITGNLMFDQREKIVTVDDVDGLTWVFNWDALSFYATKPVGEI